jgi:protein-S-isoprenylcysteine O-methyltransferase Ste14
MTRLANIRSNSSWTDIVQGQLQHLAIAILMSVGAVSLLANPSDAPKFLYLTSYDWAIVSIGLAIVHQIIVAMGFRLQLYRNALTRMFGARDMQIWAAIFMPLLAARPISLIIIGWIGITPITGMRIPEMVLGVALIGLAIWAMHSVLVYFTLRRALGGDHFRDEIANMPLVDQGAFKYTNNAMYGVAFLGLWGIALAFGSWNALVVAFFQHGYIWIHMYCTEAPDMRRIYGS